MDGRGTIDDWKGSKTSLGHTRTGFVIPAVRQGKQVMAWGVIGYNHKGPLYRFDLQACTPPLFFNNVNDGTGCYVFELPDRCWKARIRDI